MADSLEFLSRWCTQPGVAEMDNQDRAVKVHRYQSWEPGLSPAIYLVIGLLYLRWGGTTGYIPWSLKILHWGFGGLHALGRRTGALWLPINQLPVCHWWSPLDLRSVRSLSSFAADHGDDLRLLCSQHRVQTQEDRRHHLCLCGSCHQQSPCEVWSLKLLVRGILSNLSR